MAAYVGQDLPGGGGDAAPEDIYTRKRETMLAVACEDARAMVDSASEHDVELHYGENWIYAPAIQRAAELTASSSGALLEMRGWESHSGSHSPYAKDFTLPEQLRFLCRANPETFYRIFFACAAQAIKDVLKEPRHLGGQCGFFGMLQTWTQELRLHPHIHFVVPGVGIAKDGKVRFEHKGLPKRKFVSIETS